MTSKENTINYFQHIRAEGAQSKEPPQQPAMHLCRYLMATIFPVLLLAIVINILIAEKFNDIAIIDEEIIGLEVIYDINRAVTALQRVRGLWQIRLQGGEKLVSSEIENQQIEFESALGDLIKSQGGAQFKLRHQFKTLQDDLNDIEASSVELNRANTLFEEQSEYVNRLLDLMQITATRSSLILDPKLESYLLMELVVKLLPEAAESVGLLRGIVSGLAMKDTLTEADIVLLQGYRTSLELNLKKILRSYHAANRALSKTGDFPELGVEEFVNASLAFAKEITYQFKVQEKNKDAFKLFTEATKLIELNISLNSEASSQLTLILEQRISSLHQLISYSILLAILVSLLVWYFVTGFYRSNHRMFKRLLLDITRRKKAEAELLNSELRNSATIDAALDGIITIDAEGRVIEFNPSAEKIFGFRNKVVLGQDIADLIIPTDLRDKHRQGMKRYCETGHGSLVGNYVELRALRADGTEFPIELTIIPFHHKGEKLVTAFIRDITERQQLQKQLQQIQKMESIGQLTGGLAHDFNNMLASIMGYTELARDGLTQSSDEEIEDYLSEIYKSGERASELVSDMLAFSSGGEGKLKPLKLANLIKESMKMLSPTLPSSIEIDLQLDDGEFTVMTNPVQLHQLIMNLCINAQDVMKEKGHITIGLQRANSIVTECRSCHEKVSGDYIKLFIHDTGPGILPRQLDHIFDPFYTTKKLGTDKGTGMGLSMVHGIMHNHGGHVVVETGPDKGTTFTLLFPVIDTQIDTVNMKDSDTTF